VNLIRKQTLEIKEEMNNETYEFFIKGLRLAISRAGYTDKDFAAGIMNPVTLSKNLNGKYRMKDLNIDKCLEKLNMDILDVAMMGRELSPTDTGALEIGISGKQLPGVEAKHIDPMAVLSILTAASAGVQVLVDQYQKNDARMRYWQAIFENLPASVVVIKDGIVYSQNIKSRDLEIITGKQFCENCAGETCENKDICPVHIAATMAKPASGYKIIKGALYKLDVEYVRLNDHEYLIILATETSNDMSPFNRRKTDRRKDQECGE